MVLNFQTNHARRRVGEVMLFNTGIHRGYRRGSALGSCKGGRELAG